MEPVPVDNKVHLKKYGALIIIAAALLIVAVAVTYIVRSTGTRSLLTEESYVIVSEMIVKSPKPNGGDKFWATMYRQDPASGKIYFVVDRDKSLVKEMAGVDLKTFVLLAGMDRSPFSYARDRHGIYCNDKLRPDIDAATFQIKERYGVYAKDSKNVYVNCEVIPDADPATITEIGTNQTTQYAKDKNRVYFRGVPIPAANPLTFNIVSDDKYSFDEHNLYIDGKLVGKNGYTFDAASEGKISLLQRPNRVIFETSTGTHIVSSIRVSEYYGLNKLSTDGGKIYFINTEGTLSSFDSTTNAITSYHFPGLELLNKEGAPRINDYYVDGNYAYLLYGDYCKDHMTKCDVGVLKYNLSTLEGEVLQANVNVKTILGLNEEKGILYLRISEGDAGCVWGEVYAFDINQKNIVDTIKISACSDEGPEAEYIEKVRPLTVPDEAMKKNPTSIEGIYIKNGRVI